VQLVNMENMPQSSQPGPLRSFLSVFTTFGSNIVERFHEYADARLTEELTIVEQRRRLLRGKPERRAMLHETRLVQQPGHLE
jgi:hypothetical protein